MADDNRTWFHRSGAPGWVARSLLWFVQSTVVTAAVYAAAGTLAASLLGGLAAALLLFRQVDGMLREREPA